MKLVKLFFLVLFFLSCNSKSELATVTAKFDRDGKQIGIPVTLEVADDPSLRAKGLMFRRKMSESNGMIFVFDNEEQRSFWMHNTYISLDMLFLSKEFQIQGILENVPILNDSPRKIPGIQSKFVVELVAGFTSKYGVKSGDYLRVDSKLAQFKH